MGCHEKLPFQNKLFSYKLSANIPFEKNELQGEKQ
jgi:hypothetical protein